MKTKIILILFFLWIPLSGAAADVSSNKSPDSLKEVYAEDFVIGVALNSRQIMGEVPFETELIRKQFNSITPENVMKWQMIHPKPGHYNYKFADRYVEFGQNNGMFIVGHTLVWHNQTPQWVFENADREPADRQTLLARMKEHIFTVMGRYKGRIHGWDVVNEAVEKDGTMRNSQWFQIIGEDFIAKAFEYAHEADPNAELYYNDYDMWMAGRREGVVRMVKTLQAKGLRIDGIGMQGHWELDCPSIKEVEKSINAFASLGLKVMITELDVTVLPNMDNCGGAEITKTYKPQEKLNPYPDVLPGDIQEKLAKRYAEIFSLFHQYADKISRVTFWGLHDGISWKNNWPINGRTDYPLLFDRKCRPKAAFDEVMAVPKAVKQMSKTFTNPILSGFYPDPSICRAGEDYYIVNSSFEYFPGVPIFHSRDLVNWEQIGYCLTRKSQLPLDKCRSSGGIYAPSLRWDNGIFYMVTTNVCGLGNFYVTAKNPAGPWSEPIRLDGGGIDPSLFFDDDGTVYYTRHEGMGDGYIGQQVLDLKRGQLQGTLRQIWRGTGGIWPEGPHLYKIKGKYYLMIAEGGTSYGHMITIARSDSPFGPFESNPDNPILTHRNQPERLIQATGHGDLVETPAGWWMVCLGIRPQGGQYHHLGRETFLVPVDWDKSGWPVVNNQKGVEVTMKTPGLPAYPFAKAPPRDDFNDEKLGLVWNYLRNPYEENYSLTQRRGYLSLKGTAVTMNDTDSPTFVGRRQTDLNCHISAGLDFTPESENEEAGIAIRGNEKYHYDLGLTQKEGKRKVFFRKVLDGKAIEPVVYESIPEGAAVLTVKASALSYEFSCQASETSIKLGSALTKDLSSEIIGGFTGVYIGMYATGNGQKCLNTADFDYFEYKQANPD